MPIRLGHFYASLLLLTCLGTNVAFFPEVREPFLGDEDPLASIKESLSDLKIKARFAEIYPKIRSKVESALECPTSPASTLKESVKQVVSEEKPAREPTEISVSPPNRAQREPLSDPFLLPSSPREPFFQQTEPKEMKPEDFERQRSEKAKPIEQKKEAALNRQISAIVPKPQAAAARVVVVDQFKPIVTLPKPNESAKPSSEVVWDTIDTITEHPLRYD